MKDAETDDSEYPDADSDENKDEPNENDESIHGTDDSEEYDESEVDSLTSSDIKFQTGHTVKSRVHPRLYRRLEFSSKPVNITLISFRNGRIVDHGHGEAEIIHGTWISRNGTVWNTQSVKESAGRRAAANIIHIPEGPTRFALRNVDDPLSAFQLFMRKPLLAEVIKWTNIEGRHIHEDTWTDMTEEEFQRFLGLLILSGVYKSRNESIIQLWSLEDGRSVFGETMARTRFQQISRALRFDDAAHRRERRNMDKLAPIRHIFDSWESNLSDAFVPGENVTVDEQLLTFRGRVPFKQYIPSKPGKYGIKFWMLSDSATSYVLRLQMYTGKEPGEKREQNQGERVVLQLTEGLIRSGRNVTVDNFFCSLSLAQQLLDKQLTLVGTMRKNRKELPQQMLITKGRDVFSSLFAFRKDATLVSYCPKKGKVVCLLSSSHNQDDVDYTRPDKKPDIILKYNSTKGGVDTADQMLRTYSTKRRTRRWPVAVFYNMLDISALNAFIIWMSLNPHWNSKSTHRRRLFQLALGKQLIHNNYRETSSTTEATTDAVSNAKILNKRARCHRCSRDKDRKCGTICYSCGLNVCKDHSEIVCASCISS